MKPNPTALLALLLLASTLSQAQTVGQPRSQAATDRVLVQFEEDKVVAMEEKDFGVRFSGVAGSSGVLKYQITDDASVEEKVALLSTLPGIKKVEPDYKVFVNDFIPNDERYRDQWHLPKVSAPAAWDITTGLPDVKVCVVDSGARIDHPDLANVVLKGFNLVPTDERNPATVPKPGEPAYSNYNDTLGHGTHVAGTIAALGNNARGVAGVAWNVKLVVCKFIWNDGSGYISDAMNCLKLCRGEGALISSNSWGGIGYSDFLNTEISRANSEGQLFVVAAGNNGQNMETNPLYPSSYKIDNVLSVASTDSRDMISGFSNYGGNTIHISAPGEGILAATYDGGYGLMWGTSMACPIVTGTAALVQSVARAAGKTLSHLQIKQYVLQGVDATTDGQGKVITGGRLNVYKALQAVLRDYPALPSPPPPSPPPPPPPSPAPPARTVTCGTSFARGKAALQSSTSSDRRAGLAVDGNCNSLPEKAPFCAQTDINDPSPWWVLDLGQAVNVQGVLITTRSDYGWAALGNTQVLLGSVPWAGPASAASFTTCGQVKSSFGPGIRQPVYCNGGDGVRARYVVLHRPTLKGSLTLCEVDILTDSVARSMALSADSEGQQAAEGGPSRKMLR